MHDITFDNIQKTILRFSVYLAFDPFECPSCSNETIVANTSSSKFCSKYISKTTQQRATHVSVIAFESKHSHIVFTIPQEFRLFFLIDRSLFKEFLIVSHSALCKYR